MCGTVCEHETLPPTLEFPARRPKHKYTSQIHSAVHANTIADISHCSNTCQLTVSHIRPNFVGKCLERGRESSFTNVTWLRLHGPGTRVRFQDGTRVFSRISERHWYSPTLLSKSYRGLLPPLLKPSIGNILQD
jgi:hypothetical protein